MQLNPPTADPDRGICNAAINEIRVDRLWNSCASAAGGARSAESATEGSSGFCGSGVLPWWLQLEAAALERPLLLLLQQLTARQPHKGGSVGEAADNVGAAFDRRSPVNGTTGAG